MSTLQYQQVPQNDSEKADLQHEQGLEFSTSRRPRTGTFLSSFVLSASAFVLGVVFSLSYTSLTSISRPYGRYETGFQEEKILPPSTLQLEQVRFKSPVDFEMNGHEFLVVDPDEKIYIGDSWAEIDRNWEELLWGRYFSISKEEARKLWGPNYEDYWDPVRSGYSGGFDMFHQLHCLNQIRQAFHRDIYPEIPIHGEVHLEHCINHLRQAIMCWGNTAITPLKFFPGYHAMYVKTDAVHTCRKFEPIREYVSERFNGSLAVPRPSGYVDNEDNAF